MLGIIGKSTSADASPQPPLQLLRDLQDSVERESDLKDQLKFAEEEVSIFHCSKYCITVIRGLTIIHITMH